MMGSLKDLIKSLADRHKIDEIRFSNLEQEQRELPRLVKRVNGIQT